MSWILPYLLLWAALAASMTNFRFVWWFLMILSVAAAVDAGIVEWAGLAALAILAGACFAAVRAPGVLRALAWAVVVILAAALATNQVPGIHNIPVLDGVAVSASSADFTLFWNYDKGFAGILLYAVFVQPQKKARWNRAIAVTGTVFILTLVSVAAAGTAMGYIAWDPKWPAILAVWVPSNLLLTCVSEETFFRGILQRRARRFLRGRVPSPALVALLVGAVAFGVVHAAGGAAYVLLATLAGIGYGAAYHLTGRVEAGIAVHFLVNLSHLFLFTYPFAAAA
ncbi:CPBP family intramembrane glutamic endopeptidase [Candidatus Palauibacter sp.]|uniref:CPBP family intramembrane glutamic endopeptidase n=1 Tax=Candidatus Palauibacter sp. TaxID=3101350 RepID=UPI003B012C15